jgi:uncharacterized membrane protein
VDFAINNNNKDMCIDVVSVLSIIVGVLSVLVVILIGWQIWNSVSLERRLKKRIDKRIEKAKKEIKVENEFAISISLEYLIFCIFQTALHLKNQTAIFGVASEYFKVIDKYPEGTDKEKAKTRLDGMLGVLIVFASEFRTKEFSDAVRKQFVDNLRKISYLSDESFELLKLLDF